jgi:hypothetical protein
MSSAAGGAPKLAGDAAHEAIGDATLDFLYLEYRFQAPTHLLALIQQTI